MVELWQYIHSDWRIWLGTFMLVATVSLMFKNLVFIDKSVVYHVQITLPEGATKEDLDAAVKRGVAACEDGHKHGGADVKNIRFP